MQGPTTSHCAGEGVPAHLYDPQKQQPVLDRVARSPDQIMQGVMSAVLENTFLCVLLKNTDVLFQRYVLELTLNFIAVLSLSWSSMLFILDYPSYFSSILFFVLPTIVR